MNDDRFSSRWDIPWLDVGFVQVPNCFFRHYKELGITRDEFLFIMHLATYKYESARGYAYPSLGTIAQQMGLSRRQVRRLRKSLEDNGWLTVYRRPGETSVYSFQAFALAMMRLEEIAVRPRLPGQGPEGRTPVSEVPRTPVSEGVGQPCPRGSDSPVLGVGHPCPPNKKQETEKKTQQQPGCVVLSPAAGEGEGDPEARKRSGGEVALEHVWEVQGHLQDIGIGQEEGISLIKKYGVTRILDVLAAVAAQGSEIRDPAAWVVVALRQKFKFLAVAPADEQAEKRLKQRQTCMWRRNPVLGECPSMEAGRPMFLWCPGCEKIATG